MEELLKSVSEKAGITMDQAKAAVCAVSDYVKDKMPVVGEQVDAFLKGEKTEKIADMAKSLKDKLGL